MSNAGSDSGGFWSHRFVRFLLAGGFSAIVNFGSRFVFSLAFDFSVAVVLAFCVGLFTAYVLNKRYVFTESKNSRVHEVSWFVVINLLALLQTWGLSVYLVEWLPEQLSLQGSGGVAIVEAVAHGAGIILPVFTSYIGHKYLSFRE
ncbi:MAG: putative flippase GtrA [Halioglobus sp.]|jgi:putative flippase GtrA